MRALPILIITLAGCLPADGPGAAGTELAGVRSHGRRFRRSALALASQYQGHPVGTRQFDPDLHPLASGDGQRAIGADRCTENDDGIGLFVSSPAIQGSGGHAQGPA